MRKEITPEMKKDIIVKSKIHLDRLCVTIPSRRVGSQGNRDATKYFTDVVSAYGFRTECQEFDCIDWESEGAELTTVGGPYSVFASPYSLGGDFKAPLAVVTSVEELEASDLVGKIVLLKGEIAKEQLMPKEFTFFNPDEHKRIYTLLEQKNPLAIIAATSKNRDLAAALYPFPLIEDGDFDIPSVYMKDVDGERLAEQAGEEIILGICARRIPAKGCNVIARKGSTLGRRVVFFAHIDAHIGTPGALDNGASVVVLLLLAELLSDYTGELGVEIVPMNGEDYYAASGENQWIAANQDCFDEIALGINMDGLGYIEGQTAYSFYNLPADIKELANTTFSAYPGFMEGQPWYQSDHGLFIQNGIPAIAVTCERFDVLAGEIAHTMEDEPSLVDHNRVMEAACAMRDLVLELNDLM